MNAAAAGMVTLPNGASVPDVRPQMVAHSRKLLLAQVAEIQFLRGRRMPSRTRPVCLHVLMIRDRAAAARRRLAHFRRDYAAHRALAASLRRPS